MERYDPKSGGRPESRKLQGLRRPLARQLVQPFARRLVRQPVQPFARSFAKPFARPFARAFAPLGRLPFALLAVLLATACSEPVDVFYSTDYPVLRVEAEVTLDGVSSGGGETGGGSGEAGTPGGTGTDEPSGDNTGDNPSDDGTGSDDPSGDGTGTGTGDPEPPADTEALVDAIRAAVLSEAPVAAGGSYRLDFNRADGGDLYVTAAAGAEPVAGSFTKIPASTELTFAYGDHTYTAHLSHYTDGGGPSRVRFAVDLTALYRERYGIESGLRVVRYEYTDHLTD